MADEADRANDLAQQLLNAALAKKPVGPSATGACLWCGEPLPDGRRWCWPECHNAWEAHQD
jgi:RNA polymerase-binding transcription factor DksA